VNVRPRLAPGVPEDYYERIDDAELTHSWYRAMWTISASLLGERMHASARALDAGCGTGGYMRFLLDHGRFASVTGTDIAETAVELARKRVPEAATLVAPLRALPFPDGSFELVVSNDVLQHVPDADVHASLLELRRVLTQNGALLLRTNGSRRLRRERDDWRAYDAATLRLELERAGFAVQRLTYANSALSVARALRGRVPHAPTDETHGIPARRPGRVSSLIARGLSAGEARWIARGGTLPYGHTLFALAGVRR
jgi:ubiquinone/menaquinone biosynthesis C-methylase UbiE